MIVSKPARPETACKTRWPTGHGSGSRSNSHVRMPGLNISLVKLLGNQESSRQGTVHGDCANITQKRLYCTCTVRDAPSRNPIFSFFFLFVQNPVFPKTIAQHQGFGAREACTSLVWKMNRHVHKMSHTVSPTLVKAGLGLPRLRLVSSYLQLLKIRCH